MAPTVHQHAARVGIDRPEQCPERIEKSDHENARPEGLQIFWQKPNPEFFARANQEDRDEQNAEIAFQPEEIGETPPEGAVRDHCDIEARETPTGNERTMSSSLAPIRNPVYTRRVRSIWKKIRHRIEWAALRIAGAIIPLLSRKACYHLAQFVGGLAAVFDRHGRRV